MYHAHKKSGTSADKEMIPADCFVERTRSWLWTIIIFVFGIIIYGIVTSAGQGPAYSATGQSFPQGGGQFQNTALTQCPHCSGFLDANRRCNLPGCPIYSPNWGKTSTAVRGIPVRRILTKELALEVGASQGKGSVIIQSVYPGGNAEKAGLQAGDKIVQFNGRKIKNVKQFQSVVARVKPESNVKVKVVRNGTKVKAVVMISEGQTEGLIVPPK